MRALAQAVAIGGASLAAAGGTFWIRGGPDRSPEVVECDPAALKSDELCLETVIAEGVETFLWIDARSRAEWQASGYPGSLLWNLDADEDMNAFAADVVPLMVEGPKVLVYCGSESCGLSREVANHIRKLDLGNEIFVLYGGWQALQAAGLVSAPN
jgi:rhodanese-related sulfurtransferase